MGKICFLFGAGAEAAYGIGEGVSFIAPLLTSRFSDERKSLLGDKKSNYQLVYSASKTIYLQTIVNNAERAKIVFDPETFNRAITAYNTKDYSECQDLFYDFYDIIKTKNVAELPENKKLVYDFFLENAVFFDVLDGKFNDLRKLPLHSNGYRVLNAYVTIFILMLKSLYKIEKKFEWTWPNVLDLLLKPYDNIVLPKNSYYSILKKTFGKDYKEQYGVFTTNYTSIAESVLGKENVGYLHGRLNWFEDYNELRVYDAYNSKERETILEKQENIVPFILIPSGVKPLICSQQIKEFAGFIDRLNDSKFLCVVGYKFNSEDNHINSIIAEWLAKSNNKLVFLNFNHSLEWADVEWAKNMSHEEICVDNLDEITTSNASILNIGINGNNWCDVFQKVVTILGNA